MPKLILSASLLLILEISIAQTANDRKQNIIASPEICISGLLRRDLVTADELLKGGESATCQEEFRILSFTLTIMGDIDGACSYLEFTETL